MANIVKSLSRKVDKKTGKSEILIRFVCGHSIMLRAKSRVFIKPEWWNEKKKCLRTATVNMELVEANTKISDLESLIFTKFAEVDQEKTPIDSAWLQNIVDEYHNPSNPDIPTDPTFFEVIDSFINSLSTRQTDDGKLLAKGSIPQYKVSQKHLQEFAKHCRKKDFKLEEINIDFYKKYLAFLQSQGKTTNTIGREIKCIKVYIHQLPTALQAKCDISKFKVITEDVDNTYLNEDELQQLKDFNLSSQPHLERIRDWFLILAWTGCRISDMPKITKADIEKKVVTYHQQKTNNKVTIPLHPVVIEILEKYNYTMPEAITDQRFNDYIKEAAHLAGLTKKESITWTEGGVTKTQEFEQWELISSHTGRRSFATNAYKRGIPAVTIMAITGHKTEKAFLKYIKIKQEEHARIMAEQWAKMYGV